MSLLYHVKEAHLLDCNNLLPLEDGADGGECRKKVLHPTVCNQ